MYELMLHTVFFCVQNMSTVCPRFLQHLCAHIKHHIISRFFWFDRPNCYDSCRPVWSDDLLVCHCQQPYSSAIRYNLSEPNSRASLLGWRVPRACMEVGAVTGGKFWNLFFNTATELQRQLSLLLLYVVFGLCDGHLIAVIHYWKFSLNYLGFLNLTCSNFRYLAFYLSSL